MKELMNQHSTKQEQGDYIQTQSFDDRPAEIDELDFDDEERTDRVGEPIQSEELQQLHSPERAREAGLTGAAALEYDATDDDLTPENLIAEDGARSPREPGDGEPAEWDLTEKYDVGGGHGLDEAELARRDPLDKKPWDGDPDEPLAALPEAGEEFLTHDDEDGRTAD